MAKNMRISWDYDRIRQNIKKELTNEKLNEPKGVFTTTNKLLMTGQFLMPYRMSLAEKKDKSMRPGGDINCF